MTDREWFARAAAELGPLPPDYLVVDIETTGLAEFDLPIQIGWALVEGGRASHVAAEMLDWSAVQSDVFLDRRLDSVRQQIARRDNVDYPFTAAMLRRHGRPHADVLEDFLALHSDAARAGMPVVCHNGLQVDVLVLDRVCRQHVGVGFAPPRYLDTMALERALQTRASPLPGETWDRFCRRTYRAGGSKVRSSLVGHCAPKYKLAGDLSRVHQADVDCHLTHRLVEAYRDLCPDHLRGLPPGRPASAA